MTGPALTGRVFLTGFDAFVCEGETITGTREGFELTARIAHDDDTTPPWDREDRHGPVSGWTRRAKRPGERVLCEDRLSGARHYDFAEAVRIARRDGWRASGDPGLGTPGEVAARAAAHDFEALRAWCADEWFYCGVVLSVSRDGVTLDDHAASLWGIEANHPGSDNAYLTEVAEELAEEARGAGREALSRLCRTGGVAA
jgi:hypothetical protein